MDILGIVVRAIFLVFIILLCSCDNEIGVQTYQGPTSIIVTKTNGDVIREWRNPIGNGEAEGLSVTARRAKQLSAHYEWIEVDDEITELTYCVDGTCEDFSVSDGTKLKL